MYYKLFKTNWAIVSELTADLINKVENIKNTREVLKLENIICQMKIWLKSRGEMVEETESELEDRTIKIIQSQENRIKDHQLQQQNAV